MDRVFWMRVVGCVFWRLVLAERRVAGEGYCIAEFRMGHACVCVCARFHFSVANRTSDDGGSVQYQTQVCFVFKVSMMMVYAELVYDMVSDKTQIVR